MSALEKFESIIKADEEPLKVGPATFFRNEFLIVMGNLLITDKRLIFKSYKLFQSVDEIILDLKDVTRAIFNGGFGANGQISVCTQAEELRFGVSGGLDWVEIINNIVLPKEMNLQKDEEPHYIKELEGLKRLLDEGILTEEEYTSKKRQILGI